MPEYIAIIICVCILALTGALKRPCSAMGISVFEACYTLFCVLALSIFQLGIGVEVSINLGAAAMAVLPGFIMKQDRKESSAGIGAVMLISIITALLKRNAGMYGIDNGMLCGLMAGASAFVYWDSPCAAVCAAGGIPLITTGTEAALSLVFSGYTSVEIGHDTIAAQLIAVSISVVIIWVHSLLPERAKAE